MAENPYELEYKYIETGVDLANRRIYISGDIEPPIIDDAIKAIHVMERLDVAAPIDIYICSGGGLVYLGMALYDTIINSSCVIRTYTLGNAMSMAFILLLAGDERYAYPSTRLMIHEVSSGSFGKASSQEIELEETKSLNELLIEILGERTKKKASYWREAVKFRDIYMDVKEAKKLGVLTGIIGE